MLFGLFRRIVFVIPSLVFTLASAQSTSSLSSIPPSLATLIPTCASACVLNYINQDFPACPTASELDCLCSRYSKDGFSLGEIALGCVFAACSSEESSSTSAYTICANEQNAVPGTHTAITVTQALSSSTPPPDFQSTRTTHSSTVAESTATARHSSSKLSAGDAAETGPGPSVAAATPRPTNSNSSPGPLTVGQIVGVSVAGAASLIVVVGGLIAVSCVQRRRDRNVERRLRYSKEKPDSSTVSSTPLQPSQTAPYYLKDPKKGIGGVGVAPSQRSPRANLGPGRQSPNRLAKLQTSMRPVHRHHLSDDRPGSQWINPDVRPEEIGLALSPESDHQSPDSYQSTKSTSHLLPENPRPADRQKAAARFPVIPQMQRPDSTASQMTVFEEDSKSPDESKTVIPQTLQVARASPVHTARLSPSNVRPLGSSQQSPKPPPPLKLSSERRPPQNMRPLIPPQQSPKPPPPLKLATEHRHPQNARLLGPSQQIPKPTPPPKGPSAYRPSPEPKGQVPLTLEIPVRLSRVPQAPEPLKSPVKVYAPPIYTSQSPQEAPPLNWAGGQTPQVSGGPSNVAPPNTTRKTKGYLPKYYTRTLHSNGTEKDRSPRVVDIRGPGPRSSRSNSYSKPPNGRSGRESSASYTTFESADPEEPTPPEDEEKQLTPVAESPISGLRYPKVPRPSNQAVLRNSPSRTPPDREMHPPRSASLLAKRRGDQAALELERSLLVPGSSTASSMYSRASNMSGTSRTRSHHRTASDGTIKQLPMRLQDLDLEAQKAPRSAEMMQGLKSPMWAPRITPSRRGDDLFLSVSKIYTE